MKFLKIVYVTFITVLLCVDCHAEGLNDSWAKTTLQKMSQDEKIGQLFMVAAYVDSEYAEREIGNPHIIQDMDDYIIQYHVGGLAYVGPSECLKQVALTNHYQEISKYPLLIAQDLEWGLTMRIKDAMRFPKNITLGSLNDNHLIYEMGKEVGRQAKLIGVHMNLSPVLDVNIELENISINIRSFGSSPQKVSEKGIAMIRGLQEAGIIASAKHFPGLGDIAIDPHLGLPFSKHDKKRLHDVELYPFVQAINAGVMSIQTEHLVVPALDESKTPASLSSKIVNDLLKQELGFKGLVLSGALRMKALTLQIPDEEIILKSFLAGSDMLLMPQDFPKACRILKMALAEGKITEKDVDERVLKILQMKEKVQLNRQSIVAMPTMEQLHTPAAKALKEQLYRDVVALERNNHHLVPVTLPRKDTIAYVQLGEDPSSTFFNTLKKNFTFDSYIFSLDQDNAKEQKRLFEHIDDYSLIVVAVYPADPRRIEQIRLLKGAKQSEELKNFRVHGMTESLISLTNALQSFQKKTIVAFFGNPFGLHFFDPYSTVIMAYENDPDAQRAAAHLLFRQ